MIVRLSKKLFLKTAILVAGLFVALCAPAQGVQASALGEYVPDWYVAPVIPAPLRAPKHAPAAAACLADSVLTFNIDSVLTEVTVYGYDAAGHTTSATVWTCSADGLRTGKNKNEYGYTGATQTMTAVYEWNAEAADWKGTEKHEYTYAGGRMTSNTSSLWLNGAWVADQRYVYAYDAAGNQTDYFELKRNTATNKLDSVKGWVRAWENGLQTLDAQYTAYANGKWTAGTKNEWAFDAEGTQTMKADYTISNGKWVGTSKEEWGYTAGTLTMHATYGGWADYGWVGSQKEEWTFDGDGRTTLYVKYGWAAADWTPALQEENEYDGDILVRVENYTWTAGTKTGTKKELWSYTAGVLTAHELYNGWANNDWVGAQKEEYTFTSSNKPSVTTIYRWSNGAWTGSEKEEWTYNASGKQTLHTKAAWAANGWTLTLQEENEYEGANLVRVENYKWTSGVKTGTKKELTTYTAGKKTAFVTYAWSNGEWVGSAKEEWTYNASGKQTLHTKAAWADSDWTLTLQEENEYSGTSLIRVENYSFANGTKTGTKKETYAYTSGKKTQTVTYAWAENDWTVATEENTTYAGANVTAVENYSWTDGVKTGTKKEAYTYTSGKQTQVLTYQWYNNDWAYSTKEDWTYSSGKQTRYEKYGWNGLEWVDMQREIAAFDAAGNQILVENYALLTTTGWTGLKKEEYAFDGGTKTTTVIYAWADNAWTPSTKNEAGYQNGNTAVSEANYTWNGTAWQGTGTRTETTTENGLLTELLTQNWPAGATEWTNATVTRNTYNADGENIMTYNGTWNGTRWAVSSMTRLDQIFDAEGRQLLKASWQCGSDSVWMGVEKDTTYYSVAGKILYSARFKGWKNNDWVPVSKTENTYNADDKPLREESYNWTNNKWQGVYLYVSEYDAQGRRTSYTTYNSWNTTTNSFIGSSKQEYVFYKNYTDVYESKTSYRWKSNAWRPSFQYKYIYDSSDREIEQIVQVYSGGEWYNSERFVKEYKGNKLVKSNNYVWWNEEWLLSVKNELYYDEDTQAKLRREILGTWNYGVMASFSDKHYMYSCDALTIRFVNYDGTLLETQEVNKGETPVYTGATPVRESNAEHTYTFAGWTPKIAPATGNVTYTATFTDSKNTYTVTWKNEDGSVIESETLEYGATPAHADIYKEKTAQYTYTFTGWTPGIGIVTGNAEYTATFDSIVNSYTINWLNADGSQINQMVTNYGESPTAPADPTKESTAQYTYTFAGWTPEVETVTADATYTATFDSIVNSYTINWLNSDNSPLAQTTVAYGEAPTAPADPTKESTAEYTYTFAGWDKEIVPVEGDATYTATYDSIVNRYTVTWLNEDGSVIASETLEYGATPAHADIYKEKTAQYTYTFTGWTPGIGIVTGNAEYTATFDSTRNSYTVNWLNEDGSVIASETLEYGATPAHADIYKENTPEYTYIFAGWSPAIASVEGDATYQATFTTTKRTYTVNWLNADSSLLAQTTVAYGESPVYTGEKPSRPTTAEYTYTFAGWDKEIVPVEGDATYTATYDSVRNSYTVTFYYEDGVTVLDEVTVQYGETPSTSLIPSKYSEEHYYYTFAGWSPEVVPAEGNASYTATFKAVPKQYTVTFKNHNGRTLLTTETPYGEIPEYTGETPTRTKDKQYTYTFAGWSPELTEVTGPTTYTAVFEGTLNQYTVIFLDEDGTELDRQTLDYGTMPVYEGETPAKDDEGQYGYTFKGWSPKLSAVSKHTTYRAVYTRRSKTQGIEDVQPPYMEAQKILIGNTIYILRGGKTYTLQGVEVNK